MKLQQPRKVRFHLDVAKQMVDSFAFFSGVQTRLYSADGVLLYEKGEYENCCSVCQYKPKGRYRTAQCEAVHRDGVTNAERFGGRYIFSCSEGMTYFSSPIIVGGQKAGAIVAGPILLLDVDEYIDEERFKNLPDPELAIENYRNALEKLPQVSPRNLNLLSLQLFSCVVYISDSVQELIELRKNLEQQDMIGDYIYQLKKEHAPKEYPKKKEDALANAIFNENITEAEQILNELLSSIFYLYDMDSVIKTRIRELIVIMSRAAISTGADAEMVLDLNLRFYNQMPNSKNQQVISPWLHSILLHFINMVLPPPETVHRNALHEALSYMQSSYMKDLKLDDVAEKIGYSSAYFSKIFKEEMGESFRNYLTRLRMEHSKMLLLTEDRQIADVASVVGFDDQSYFCKVFKKYVGVTPDAYRKRSRRLDEQKEHGENLD